MRIPIPLLVAALIITAGVIIFYIAMLPNFVWTNVSNSTTVAISPGSSYTFLVVGTSATITVNSTSANIVYMQINVPAVYSAQPITGDIATSKGTIYLLSNATGTYLRYDAYTGCSFYLVQASPSIWVPDLKSDFSAVDPTHYNQQVVSVSMSTTATTLTTRGGSTCSYAGAISSGTSSVSLAMTTQKISDTMYVYWGYAVAIQTSVPLKVTITT